VYFGSVVMAALEAAIQKCLRLDGRVKPGHDKRGGVRQAKSLFRALLSSRYLDAHLRGHDTRRNLSRLVS